METAMSLTGFITANTPVRVTANANLDGRPIITPMANKDGTPKTDMLSRPLGSIMLEQYTSALSGSFLNNRRRVAFISGTIEALEKLVAQHKLVEGSEIPGKIKVRESISPFWEGQNPKINPSTKEQIGIKVGEKFFPIYLQMLYTEDVNAKDIIMSTPDDVIAALALIEATKQQQTVSKETASVPKTTGEGFPIGDDKESEDFVGGVVNEKITTQS